MTLGRGSSDTRHLQLWYNFLSFFFLNLYHVLQLHILIFVVSQSVSGRYFVCNFEIKQRPVIWDSRCPEQAYYNRIAKATLMLVRSSTTILLKWSQSRKIKQVHISLFEKLNPPVSFFALYPRISQDCRLLIYLRVNYHQTSSNL